VRRESSQEGVADLERKEADELLAKAHTKAADRRSTMRSKEELARSMKKAEEDEKRAEEQHKHQQELEARRQGYKSHAEQLAREQKDRESDAAERARRDTRKAELEASERAGGEEEAEMIRQADAERVWKKQMIADREAQAAEDAAKEAEREERKLREAEEQDRLKAETMAARERARLQRQREAQERADKKMADMKNLEAKRRQQMEKSAMQNSPFENGMLATRTGFQNEDGWMDTDLSRVTMDMASRAMARLWKRLDLESSGSVRPEIFSTFVKILNPAAPSLGEALKQMGCAENEVAGGVDLASFTQYCMKLLGWSMDTNLDEGTFQEGIKRLTRAVTLLLKTVRGLTLQKCFFKLDSGAQGFISKDTFDKLDRSIGRMERPANDIRTSTEDGEVVVKREDFVQFYLQAWSAVEDDDFKRGVKLLEAAIVCL